MVFESPPDRIGLKGNHPNTWGSQGWSMDGHGPLGRDFDKGSYEGSDGLDPQEFLPWHIREFEP